MSSYGGGERGRGGGKSGGRGRGGDYYKNKYGGGRGRGPGRQEEESSNQFATNTAGGTYADLRRRLAEIDGRQYPTYHCLDTPLTSKGWQHETAGFVLYMGRAQADPYANPTKCRLVVSSASALFPKDLYSNRVRAMALADYLQRALYSSCQAMGASTTLNDGVSKSWSGPKGGDVQITEPSQHVLEQTAVTVDRSSGNVCAQLTINLPARGRTILGHAAESIFDRILVNLVKQSLLYSSLDAKHVKTHVDSVEDQVWLQGQLESHRLAAFVRNGAILPRASGVDDRPMSSSSAIPFQSPPTMEISFALPNAHKSISGMGIPVGITLICGGGFHGKSTLLEALQLAVYPKLPGDGREFCVAADKAFKIRAEDGRCVTAVDISPFITNLPFGKDTTCFSTLDASGSTSQASNIVEAVEMGATVLIVDEDTCATNFMIRDNKMAQLVTPDKEPITPFVQKVRALYEERSISSILVIGGSGDYFDVADHVVMMDCYTCNDVTNRAKEIAARSEKHDVTRSKPFGSIRMRYPVGESYKVDGKVVVREASMISYGDVAMDLAGLEQIVTKSQTTAISCALQVLKRLAASGTLTLPEVLSEFEKLVDTEGLDMLAPGQFHGGLARPRLLELAGAINRFRGDGSIVQR